MSYQPQTDSDVSAMLARLGVESIEALFADVPPSLRNPEIDLPPGLSEPDLVRHMAGLAAANRAHELVCFLGAGSYDHYIPAAVDALAGRAEFVTGYTPYQAEMTQGLLQAIYEYQTIVCELTGLEAANASMYEGATALWEALLICEREVRGGRFVAAGSVSPRWLAACDSYARESGYPLDVVADLADGSLDLAGLEANLAAGGVSGVALPLPGALGVVHDLAPAIELARVAGAKVVICANPLALMLYRTPGELGADICVGDGQPLGLPHNFGGPSFGFMAVRDKLVRKMPGRIVGATVDGAGQRGFVLTLQAREQHIRRDKASSNICSNQALMALRGAMYCTLLGPQGLAEVAANSVRATAYLREQLTQLAGVEAIGAGPWFNEVALRLPAGAARRVWARGLEAGYLAGWPLGNWWPEREDELLVCATERRTRAELDEYVAWFGQAVGE